MTHKLDGGFFCQACLVDKPLDDISPDSRYCLMCFEFLTKEAELVPASRGKPPWVPVSNRAEVAPSREKAVAKPLTNGKPPVGVLQHPGGRPIKEGEVHRTTEWRRQRAKEVQGVMV